jgi:PAS domain S-box-containing protein
MDARIDQMASDRIMSRSRPPIGIFTTDTDLVVRTWDEFLATITGITAERALNRTLSSVLPELEQRGLLTVIERVVTSGTVEVLAPLLHRHLIRCSPVDGSSGRMQQRVTIGPIREEGRVTGVAVTIEDVTARMERDQELAQETLASLTRALGDEEWRARQAAVRDLAPHRAAIVDTLVRTLREQHRNFSVLSSVLDLLAITDIDVVEPLIDCMTSDDVGLRTQAALILGERRDRRAVPALVRALDDADVNVQFHAIEALGYLHAGEAAERLTAIAERRDFFLAFPAIQALARLGDVSVAPRLVPLLDDELLRGTVAEALGELGDELVAIPLAQLLNRPDAPTEVVADALADLYERYEGRYGAGEHIAGIVRRTISPVGTQKLLDAIGRADAGRLRGIARVMGWLSGPAVQRALTRLLGQPSVRAQVVEALVRDGAGVVPLLIDQLRAEDLDTRQAAALALGRIGDRRATDALVAAVGDPELALPAAGALARLGDSDAFEALLGLLDHADTAVRQAVIAALNSIGHPDMPRRIVVLLDDTSPVVRESAVKIAGYFGYRECLDRVLERCADPSEAVRRAAIDHLPFFEHPGTIPVLLHALEFDTPPVRAAAAAALARVEESQALTPLLRALGDRDPWVRYFALRSVGTFENPAVLPAVFELLERDPAGQVRLAAIDALGRLDAPDAVTSLQALSVSPEADLARAAIRALALTNDARAKPALESLIRAAEAWRRLEAVVAIGARGGAEAASTLQWVAAADTDRDVVRATIGALALMGSREGADGTSAIRALIALTAEPTRRENVVSSLAGLPSRQIGHLAAGLHHPSPDVRRATIEALSRMRHPQASEAIERALEDAVPGVRATAVAELRRLGGRHAARKLLALARTDPDIEVRHQAMLAVTQQPADLTANQLDAR